MLDPSVFGSDVVKIAKSIKEEFVNINSNLLKLGIKDDVLKKGTLINVSLKI